MVSSGNLSTTAFPYLVLLSEYGGLSTELVTLLRQVGCRLVIVSEDISSWRKKVTYENHLTFFNFSQWKDKTPLFKTDYLVCVVTSSFFPFDKLLFEKDKEKINFIKGLSFVKDAKTLFVFSYQQEAAYVERFNALVEEILSDKLLDSAAVFVGNLVNEDKDDRHSGFWSYLLKQMVKQRTIKYIPSTYLFYPLSSNSAAKLLIKNLFSLRAWGKRVAILGKPMSAKALERLLKATDQGLSISFSEKRDLPVRVPVDLKDYANENQKDLIRGAYIAFRKDKTNFKLDLQIFPRRERLFSSTPKIREKYKLRTLKKLRSFLSRKESISERVKEREVLRTSFLTKISSWQTRIFFRGLKWKVASLVCLLLTFPVIVISLSFLFLGVSKKAYSKNYSSFSQGLLTIANFSLQKSTNYSLVLSKLPLLGAAYKDFADTLTLLEKEAQIGKRIIKVTDLWLTLSEKIEGEDSYDPILSAKELKFELDILYQDLGFLEGEVRNSQGFAAQVAKLNFGGYDDIFFRAKILSLAKIAEVLPGLLGVKVPTKYVVIFQNAKFARPTGGEIVAFAMVDFSGGNILKIKGYSASFADKKLTGLVDPPLPLQKYFDQKRWFLKDANWDPDFTAAASQIEWFLDKEMDISVDGIVAIDSEFIERILEEVGEIKLEEGIKVNAKNLDDLFLEDEDNYPNSEKENSLALFSESFLKKLFSTSERRQKLILAKILSAALEDRSVQVFVHEEDASRVLSDLNLDGSIQKPDCQNCYQDLLALVEVSRGEVVGEILRQAQLTISFEEKLVKRRLFMHFDNAGESVYKLFLRLIVPGESGFSPVVVKTEKNSEKINSETFALRGLKELGVYTEILPGQWKEIEFSWESTTELSLKDVGRYAFSLRKQPGIPPYFVNIRTRVPEGLSVEDFSGFSLTQTDGLIYNTVLSKDSFLEFTWSQQR